MLIKVLRCFFVTRGLIMLMKNYFSFNLLGFILSLLCYLFFIYFSFGGDILKKLSCFLTDVKEIIRSSIELPYVAKNKKREPE